SRWQAESSPRWSRSPSGSERSESGRVAHHVPLALAGLRFPAGAGTASRAAGVQAQAGDGHENVTLAGVNGNPVPFAFLAVTEVAFGGHRALEQARFTQHIGHGAGAIVAGIVLFGVAATPLVG